VQSLTTWPSQPPPRSKSFKRGEPHAGKPPTPLYAHMIERASVPTKGAA
jgi:hypothetical protein